MPAPQTKVKQHVAERGIHQDNDDAMIACHQAAAEEVVNAAEEQQEQQEERERWGLETDFVSILAGSDKISARNREERRRLARTALHAGDADRLLLCLGRLEGEAPRTVGGRADSFDDPAAVAERERERTRGNKGCCSDDGGEVNLAEVGI